ncbi:MAG: TetR/AcrR family transcriptional regulator [Myxococcaceae bacterium]
MASRRSGAERRTQIAEAALRIISAKGVHRLTAMELAREVGIADGTIFRHFADKAEIVNAAVDHLDALLGARFPPEGGDPLERLRAFFVERTTLVRRHPEILRLAFGDRLEEAAGESGVARVRRMVERTTAFIRSCLVEAQARKLVDPSLPVEPLVWMITGMMQASVLAAGRGRARPSASPEQTWRTLEALLRRSTRKR